ncbi:hypothetical protein O3G_MSEX010562 [Manduca sexta]|uniref:Uncharacterized protein n=1 Tax=Manduca sexta TaxID=7130 RepID=A0A922CTM7_MANSE|nr:hypothetical protein O3G_MSEX010562 [Manduca sexta]
MWSKPQHKAIFILVQVQVLALSLPDVSIFNRPPKSGCAPDKFKVTIRRPIPLEVFRIKNCSGHSCLYWGRIASVPYRRALHRLLPWKPGSYRPSRAEPSPLHHDTHVFSSSFNLLVNFRLQF